MNSATGNNVTSNFSTNPAAVFSVTTFRLLFATTIFVLAYIPILAVIPKLPWNSAVKWLSLNLLVANTVQILGDLLTLAVDIYEVQTQKNTRVLSNVIFSLQSLYSVGYLILMCMLGCVQLWRLHYPKVERKWVAHLVATVVSWASAFAFSVPFVSPSVRMSIGLPCTGHVCPSSILGVTVVAAVWGMVTTLAPATATYLLYLTFLKLVRSTNSDYEDWKMLKVMSMIVILLHIKLIIDQTSLLVASNRVSSEAFFVGVFCSESSLLLFVSISAVLVVSYEPYRTKAKKVYGIKRCLSKHRQAVVQPLYTDS